MADVEACARLEVLLHAVSRAVQTTKTAPVFVMVRWLLLYL